MAAANGFGKVMVGKGGILSTPAASHVIRKYHAFGGIVLSASHNPGGPHEDFGIKYNAGNGGPAPETLTDAIFEKTKAISSFKTADIDPIDIDTIGTVKAAGMTVEIIDPVADYAEHDGNPVRFRRHPCLISNTVSACASTRCSAVTGPYAAEILEAPAWRGERHLPQLQAIAGFRRPSPRPEPGPCQASL